MIPLNLPEVRQCADRCMVVCERFMAAQRNLIENGAKMTIAERDAILEQSLRQFAADLATLESHEVALSIIAISRAMRFAAPVVLENIEDAILLHRFGEQVKSHLEAFKQN